MRNKLRLFFLVLLTFVGGLSLGLAASPTYEVIINGFPSKTKLLQDKDSLLVPLTIPVSDEAQDWTVTLVRDDKARRVVVKMAAVKKKNLRGDTDCYWCNASGECAQDYPAGSGLTFAGTSDGNCNGTGKCYHCGGTGKL